MREGRRGIGRGRDEWTYEREELITIMLGEVAGVGQGAE